MLRRFESIKDCGIFADYRWETSLHELARINVIYGGNGTGKTSLAGALDGLRHPPQNEGYRKLSVAIEDGADARVTHGNDDPIFNRIHVFSEHFVGRSHRFTPAEVDMAAVLTIGVRPVEVEIKLEALRKQIAEKLESHDKLSAVEGAANRAVEAAFGRVSQQVVDGARRAGGRWQSRGNFSAGVVQTAFGNSHDTWVELTDENLQNNMGVINSDKQELLQEPNLNPQVADDIAERLEGALSTTPTALILDTLKAHPEATSWVDSGRHLHSGLNTCIFCGSELTPERRRQIDQHFSDEVEKLQGTLLGMLAELREIEENANSVLTAIPSRGLFFKDLQVRYEKASRPLREELTALKDWVTEIRGRIEMKESNVLASVDSEVRRVPVVSGADFAALRKEHNDRSERHDALVLAAAIAVERHYLKMAESEVQKNKEIATLEHGKIEAINHELNDLNAEISTLEGDEGDPVPTAKILTQEVARLLGRNELVFEAIGGRYLVSRDGQPAIGLSAGERTAITLVHFLESVAKFDGSKGKAIVIIDDPVSSLDSEVFMGISTYIWTEAVSKDHIDQLLLLTHNFELFRQWDIQIEALHHSGKDARTGKKLEELYPAEFYEIQSRYQKIQGMPRRRPSLAPWPPSEAARKKIRSTYHHSFIAVATARKNLLEDDSLERRLDAQLLFPNVIRRMLETFLAFKRPEWVGNFNTAMRNSAQLLKDAGFQGDAEALRSRLTRYSHAYSHGDTPLTDVVVNPGEVSQAIAAVFEFMNQIDSAHFNGLCEVVGLEPVDLLPAVPNDSNEDGAAAAT